MQHFNFSPVADTTRRAGVSALLKQAILTGQLVPGQKVNELRIAEQMRVSRAPLREAIRDLVQEGLLINIPYAGAYVINITAKDIQDIYALHRALEDFAIEQIWPLRNDQFFRTLDERHDAVKQATLDGDLARQIEDALRLHSLIYEWSDNSVLLDTWRRLASRLQMIFAVHQQARNEPVPPIDIHEEYVRLFKGSDVLAAQKHAREHIDWNLEELLAYAHGLEKNPGPPVRARTKRSKGI